MQPSSENDTGVIFRKAESEEAAGGYKLAEEYYLACIASSLETKSSYYHLASVNRLTELEKKLNNPTKSKAYMNQAATLAENTKEDPEKEKTESDTKLLAQEKHLALMRLADWLYEDGNFVSARKLYEKAAELEKVLRVSTSSAANAEARIKTLDAQAKLENDGIVVGLSTSKSTNTLRGQEAAQRSKERHRKAEALAKTIIDYRNGGDSALADKAVSLLIQLRSTYGPREDEYRRHYNDLAKTLSLKENFDLLAPLLEQDMKEFSTYSQADLDAAIPESVENATFYTQDTIIMADMRFRQKRYQEMLELCLKAEKLAPKVIRPNSHLEMEYCNTMAMALEFNGMKTKALPFRRKQIELFKKAHDNPMAYSDFLHYYQLDLTDAGMMPEAEKVAEEILSIKKKLKRETHIVPPFMTYALTLIKQDKFEKARTVLLEALPHCQKYHDREALLNCYVLLYQTCGRNRQEEAIKYAKCAEDLIRKQGDFGQKQAMANALLARSIAEFQLGKNIDALHTAERAVSWQVSHEIELTAMTAAVLNFKAQIHGRLGDWEGEKKTRTQAIDVCRRLNPPELDPLTSTLLQAAFQYQKRKEFEQSEKYFREAVGLLKGTDKPHLKEMLVNSKAALASCLLQANKNRAEALSIKNEILPIYKSSFTQVSDSDLSLCLVTAELCAALNDISNLKLVMKEAESIYGKDKDRLKPFDERMEKQRKILKAAKV